MKRYYRDTLIPRYVIYCLNKYGSTIIVEPAIRTIGGREELLKELKRCGLVCELREPSICYTSSGVRDHLVIALIRRTKHE